MQFLPISIMAICHGIPLFLTNPVSEEVRQSIFNIGSLTESNSFMPSGRNPLSLYQPYKTFSQMYLRTNPQPTPGQKKIVKKSSGPLIAFNNKDTVAMEINKSSETSTTV